MVFRNRCSRSAPYGKSIVIFKDPRCEAGQRCFAGTARCHLGRACEHQRRHRSCLQCGHKTNIEAHGASIDNVHSERKIAACLCIVNAQIQKATESHAWACRFPAEWQRGGGRRPGKRCSEFRVFFPTTGWKKKGQLRRFAGSFSSPESGLKNKPACGSGKRNRARFPGAFSSPLFRSKKH